MREEKKEVGVCWITANKGKGVSPNGKGGKGAGHAVLPDASVELGCSPVFCGKPS